MQIECNYCPAVLEASTKAELMTQFAQHVAEHKARGDRKLGRTAEERAAALRKKKN